MQPSCEHGRYSRLLGTGHFHTTTMVRGRVCLRGLSSVLPLLCIVPGIPSYRCDHVTARTSDPVPFVSTPIMCAGDRAKTSSPRGPKSLPPTCWSRRTPSGSSARLLHPLPLACMYADTADWATSTAESFIRETELIQARLLEWPLACMYADTADWATSTAGSFIRETELIQARLLEWPNGELVPAVQKRCSNPCTCSQAARR
jgi:hypothetical protein